MAVNKLVDGTQLDSDLTSVANAIRLKGSTSASLSFPSGFISAINDIPSTLIIKSIRANGTYSAQDDNADGYSQVIVNVNNESTVQKSVIFIDYDGTVLYEYTAEEANALNELPTVPIHEDMISQGWNHTLEQVKADATSGAICVVGPMYTTEATTGTQLFCQFKNPNYLSPKLGIGPKDGSINIDWGDGSVIDNLSGSSSLTTLKQKQHTYATTGDYIIKLIRVEDSARFGFIGDSTHSSTLDDDTRSEVYPASIYRIMFGGDARLSSFCLSGMTHLECINTPSYLNDFPQHIFQGDLSLKAFVVPLREGRTHTIGEYAFCECNSLKYVSLSKTVTSIGSNAFQNCYSLESINLPNGLTSINSSTFRGCFKLKDVYIPNTVTSIGNYAFDGCHALKFIVMPSSITSIGINAFDGCQSLESITIPSSVTNISNWTFRGCQSLKSITIPSSVTSIGNYAFSGCQSLKSITIPSSVTSISNNAFDGCQSLESITIPSSVISIGIYAFSGCYALKSITILSSVTSINQGTFNVCRLLESITIPSSVTSIGSNAFYGCRLLESITIPSSVTNIGSNAFNRCKKMAEFHFLSEIPPILQSTSTFAETSENCIFYVPYSADHSILNAYQTAQYWSTYANRMVEEQE